MLEYSTPFPPSPNHPSLLRRHVDLEPTHHIIFLEHALSLASNLPEHRLATFLALRICDDAVLIIRCVVYGLDAFVIPRLAECGPVVVVDFAFL